MADESENIEARLAAYIDGDLPASDRADIEQYLASNPAHAALIAELREQRARLANLPREKAPAEIMDHLQQHLERHALLDESADDSVALRGSWWPQLTAVAAMLVLAAGLGLLVYQVLPGGGKAEKLVLGPNVVKGFEKLPGVDEAATEPAEDQKDLAQQNTANEAPVPLPPEPAAPRMEQARVAADAATQPSIAAAPAPQDAAMATMAKAGATPATPGVDRPRDYVEELAAKLQDQAQRKDSSAAAPHGTLTVTSDDPAMSGALIASYLAQNSITFDVPTAALAPAAPATQPSGGTTLVLHNITPDRARELQTAVQNQRVGRQQVALTLAAAAPLPVATQPAANETAAMKETELAVHPTTEPSTQPLIVAAATTQPATRPAEAGDLWIVIQLDRSHSFDRPTMAPATQP